MADRKLSLDQFIAVTPERCKSSVNQDLLDRINKIVFADDVEKDIYKNNLISFTSVLQTGNHTIVDYIAAVKFVSHKLLGDDNALAYKKTFSGRYKKLLDSGHTPGSKHIKAVAYGYFKGKLVQDIFAQTMTPVYILNMDMYQKALNTQADLMVNAKSEMVRMKAADSVMNQLKPPEDTQLNIDINTDRNTVSLIDKLREATEQLSQKQLKSIEQGTVSANDIIRQPLLIENEA